MHVLSDDEVIDPSGGAEPPEDAEPRIVPLTEPSDGIPPVVTDPDTLAGVVAAFASGSGPVAADAERASGYRYGQRTYLVQLRRAGAGTALVDPVAVPDLSGLSGALEGVEFVLHAASQDLPGFREHGLQPSSLFDTELGARILGLERVGLATVVAELLGLGLAKEHSAVDWSTRPLPAEWLRYAALDVEVLVDLRDVLAERLEAAGKLEWAHQEFEAVRTAPPPPPRPEPWRRTSGMHAIRDPRRLAVVRELWLARDESARRRDIAPGRVLPDRAIIAAAKALPRSVPELVALPEFSGKGTRRRADLWHGAVARARALPEKALPSTRGPRNGDVTPPARSWRDRDPEAASRLAAARAALAEISERVEVPVENVLLPELVRRLCWAPPARRDVVGVGDFLVAGGARPWQVELTAAPLSQALEEG